MSQLPKEGQPVLLYLKGEETCVPMVAYYRTDGWRLCLTNVLLCTLTDGVLWRPLPALEFPILYTERLPNPEEYPVWVTNGRVWAISLDHYLCDTHLVGKPISSPRNMAFDRDCIAWTYCLCMCPFPDKPDEFNEWLSEFGRSKGHLTVAEKELIKAGWNAAKEKGSTKL